MAAPVQAQSGASGGGGATKSGWQTEVVAGGLTATSYNIAATATRARFELDLTHDIKPDAFVLAEPYRVIVELPEMAFKLPRPPAQLRDGVVSGFRYGQFVAGRARFVLDVTSPVEIERVTVTRLPDQNLFRVAIDIAAVDSARFEAAQTLAATAKAVTASAPPAPSEKQAPTRKPGSKPTIVIDPGHGGIDPGAVGSGELLEKNLVLAVARQLKAELATANRYNVVLTRSSDVFVSLSQRLQFSGEQGADLFISLHADALAEAAAAQTVRGATVYVLSERASDGQARRFAEKENASDLVAGIDASDKPALDDVRGILVDLLQRETANFSAELRGILVNQLKRTGTLSRDPQREASFKVLRQTQTPAVLVELGYMSNAEDEKLFKTVAWQKQIAVSLATAVDQFFAKRVAGSPR